MSFRRGRRDARRKPEPESDSGFFPSIDRRHTFDDDEIDISEWLIDEDEPDFFPDDRPIRDLAAALDALAPSPEPTAAPLTLDEAEKKSLVFVDSVQAVSYTHLTLPTIYSV